MKKILACISLVFAMSAGVTALADGYDESKNSYTVDATGYKTVLITSDNDTLYVDQNDQGLGTGLECLLKGATKLADGTYTVKLGGHDTDAPKTETFTISSEPVEKIRATIMGREESTNGEGEAVYAVGCKATAVLNDAAYVVLNVTSNNTQVTKSISFSTGLTGDGSADLAIKVYNVPSNYVINTVGLGNVE